MWTAETVLVCALTLLGRSADSLSPIALLDTRPPGVSRSAEGFVRSGERRIYLMTDTFAFERARHSSRRCSPMQALRKIASVVVHEEWHVRHPGDEAGAYRAQLDTLSELGSGPGTPLYSEVWQSSRVVLRASQAP